MRGLLFTALIWLISPAKGEQCVFYQPLNTDAALTTEQWKQVWSDTFSSGTREVIIQWTKYGENDFGGANGWLAASLRHAHASGLKLILGLYMDDEYYSRIAQLDDRGLVYYWQAKLGLATRQYEQLRALWQLPVTGWYLPMELDDTNFHDLQRREWLYKLLKNFQQRLNAPLHLSVFNTGKITPEMNAQWLNRLSALRMHIWWQDGEGTQRLSQYAQKRYLASLSCQVGVILEAFQQTNPSDRPFTAKPAPPSQKTPACHATSVFSLRYRPWGKVILDNQRKKQ